MRLQRVGHDLVSKQHQDIQEHKETEENELCAGISTWPSRAAQLPDGFPVVILRGYGLFTN